MTRSAMSNSEAGGIFLLHPDKSLSELSPQSYDSERLLQRLLVDYPNLLAGDLINPQEPRRWLLVRDETGVPDRQDGSDRWTMDHLFLDQDGVPTIVEVKRSSDTRIRREVVGQMLDYAANCVVYFPAELIRSRFEERCAVEGLHALEEIERLVDSERSEEEFWESVRTNLQAGKVRLVFVADVIPQELRRVVEFMNQQMDPAEVLAVEIQQYVGDSITGLVPRVWGATERAQQRKEVASGRRYELLPDASVTSFWKRYWERSKEIAPDLEMAEPGAKPAGSGFISFRPQSLPKGVEIVHKLPRGNVDLQLAGWGNRIDQLEQHIGADLTDGMSIARAHKSAVIRLKVPVVHPEGPFDDQAEDAESGLRAALSLLRWFQRRPGFVG